MSYLFSSKRLGFRNWKEEDLEPFAALCANPKVMEYFPGTLDWTSSKASIDRFLSYFDQYGYTFYAVDLLHSQQFIGFIGFTYQTFESFFTPAVEIGWRLDQQYWGLGYATEGAKACLDFGFEELGFTEVYSFTAIPNKASERVMQKIGMEKVGAFNHPKLPSGHWLERHILYRIRKY